MNVFRSMVSQLTMPVAIFISAVFFSLHSLASAIVVEQVLTDGVNHVDGLDNPRQVRLSADDKYAFVISADDNSLLVLALEERLKPIQLFRSDKDDVKLDGASGLAVFNRGKNVAVSSFYASTLSVFESLPEQATERLGESHDSAFYRLKSEFSDNLSYAEVFNSNAAFAEVDSYGLVGAYDIALDAKETQLFVASYKSNAVSIFDINKDFDLAFKRKLSHLSPGDEGLGGPVSLAYSSIHNSLLVAGFDSNRISVLTQDMSGNFSPKQVIKQDENALNALLGPQKLLLSPTHPYLFVWLAQAAVRLWYLSLNRVNTNTSKLLRIQTPKVSAWQAWRVWLCRMTVSICMLQVRRIKVC